MPGETQNFTYDFGTEGSITVTADDALQNFTPKEGVRSYQGYAIESVSGMLEGKTVTLAGGSGTGQNLLHDYDNVIFDGDSQGEFGSHYGIDGNGIQLTANGVDYILSTSSGDFFLDDEDLFLLDPQLTLESSNAPCYCRGARILTERGYVAVEDLAVGDVVLTASGNAKPIRWIGHREIALDRHPEPELAAPVRFAAEALGHGLPIRDLVVSPEHAFWLEDAWIPARELINGATIRQEAWRRVEYFHIELDVHDALVAESVAAESYHDCDNRRGFDNAQVVALHPDWSPRADPRRFVSPAQAARLREMFAARAVATGRGREIAAHRARQRALALAPRTNFVRNPRAEGAVAGVIAAGGRAPDLWWFDAPAGVSVEVLGTGQDRGLPYLDLRFSGAVAAQAKLCLYPEPGCAPAAKKGEDWTFSCHLRRIGGGLDGIDGVNLYIDERDAEGAYLTGRDFPQRAPSDDGLALQRACATWRISRPDAGAVTGYVQIKLAAATPIDLTLRVAGPQIEQGRYASDLILPPPGEMHAATRSGSAVALARVAAIA